MPPHPRALPFAIPPAAWSTALAQSGMPVGFGGPGTPCPFPCPYCLRDIIDYLLSGAGAFTPTQIATWIANHATWGANLEWPPGSGLFPFPTAADFTVANIRTFLQHLH